MTTKIDIIKGEFKGQKGKVIGVYTDGRFDVKIGRKYATLKKTEICYID